MQKIQKKSDNVKKDGMQKAPKPKAKAKAKACEPKHEPEGEGRDGAEAAAAAVASDLLAAQPELVTPLAARGRKLLPGLWGTTGALKISQQLASLQAE